MCHRLIGGLDDVAECSGRRRGGRIVEIGADMECALSDTVRVKFEIV
jgi:hypothetical protein